MLAGSWEKWVQVKKGFLRGVLVYYIDKSMEYRRETI